MSGTRFPTVLTAGAIALGVALLTGCGEKKPGAGRTTAAPSAPSAPSGPTAAVGPLEPAPGGKVIVVELSSDANGNYFKPAEIHARRGDVVRYTLKVGVHNVHFLADSNASQSGYPQSPSDLLQLPGQTYDVAVSFAPGTYYFQCDPHAALGMKGHLIVE
jgi:plastocyanin